MFQRSIAPLYILILSLVSSSLILKPKNNLYLKYHKFIIFLIGFLIVIISQISFKFISQSINLDLLIISSPILLVFFYYLLLILKTKSKFRTL